MARKKLTWEQTRNLHLALSGRAGGTFQVYMPRATEARAKPAALPRSAQDAATTNKEQE
jgi:hypothetical protein